MNLENHGGGCCGVSHIFNFSDWTEREESRLRAMIEDHLSEWEEVEEDNPRRKPSHLFEVVLTDYQCENGDWPAALKRLKFKHVARWYNSNSGNYCNMFVWHRAARIKAPWRKK